MKALLDTDAGSASGRAVVDFFHLAIAGWAGRDQPAIEHHIEELAPWSPPHPGRGGDESNRRLPRSSSKNSAVSVSGCSTARFGLIVEARLLSFIGVWVPHSFAHNVT